MTQGKYIAMRGRSPVVEGDDLEQVVMHCEEAARHVVGDIMVWDDENYVVAEIEWHPEECFVTYRN